MTRRLGVRSICTNETFSSAFPPVASDSSSLFSSFLAASICGRESCQKNVDKKKRRSGGDLELSFVAGGDTCQLSKCFVHSAFHQQPARRLRYQPLERAKLRKLLKCMRRIGLLPAEEDRKDCQGCGESQQPPRGHEHGHPGKGEGGEAVAHHHHQQGHSPARDSTVLHNYVRNS